MTEVNGTAPPAKVTPDQAMVVFYYDLAMHMLQGMANQLSILKREAEVRQFQRFMEQIAEARNGFIRDTQRLVQVASVTRQ